MAKYNRDFLVPYLQNLCALYFAKDKLFKLHRSLVGEINEIEKGKPLYSPAYPEFVPIWTIGRVIAIMVSFVFLLLGIFLFYSYIEYGGSFYLVDALFFFAIVVVCIWSVIRLIQDDKLRNKDRLSEYERLLHIDREIKRENDKAREQLPALKEKKKQCFDELVRLKKLIDQAEAANVIPGQYRGEYAAVYLYDYFAHSREDDVAMALNTFVLEQIKDKLDIIIRNQSDMILNQCMMLANQRSSMEQQEAYAAMMESKLNQIQASNEERNQYLSMIESDTNSIAFFATAEYIRGI